MDLLTFLIVGLIAGFIASRLMGGPGDLVSNLVVGVIGAVVARLLGPIVGVVATNLIGQIVTATIGAAVFLAIWRAYKRR